MAKLLEMEIEEQRDQPWNFHTCKLCPYRSKSAFMMCNHVDLHRQRSKTDTFFCGSNLPEMLECQFCAFKTNLKVVLCEHVRLFHERKHVNEVQENILRCYQCKHCCFETYSVLVLTKHINCCNITFYNNLQQKSYLQDDVEDSSCFQDSSSQSSTESLESIRKQKQYSGFFKKTIGKVKINGRNVEILLSSAVHFGIYHVTLFHGVSINDSPNWIGYLRAERIVDHECFPAKAGEVTSDSARDANSMLCAFSVCCPKGVTLRGEEMFINSVGKFVTIFTAPASIESLQNEMKRHRCYFCSKLVTCIGRHLQRAHKNEPEIKSILALPPHARLKKLRKLRLQGDRTYNVLITPEEPESQTLECLKCKTFIPVKDYHKHEVKCRVEKETIMRRHCCFFCCKLVTCMGRHLQKNHRNEPEVKRILSLPSSEKVKMLRKLRLRGDKAYNVNVELDKRIPVRKPVVQQISESVECNICNGLIAKKNLRKHVINCFILESDTLSN